MGSAQVRDFTLPCFYLLAHDFISPVSTHAALKYSFRHTFY